MISQKKDEKNHINNPLIKKTKQFNALEVITNFK